MILDRPGPMLAIGVAIGSTLGAVIGITTDLSALWLTLVTMLGGVFGAGLFGTIAQLHS